MFPTLTGSARRRAQDADERTPLLGSLEQVQRPFNSHLKRQRGMEDIQGPQWEDLPGCGHQAKVGSAGQGPQGRVASKDKGKFTINDVVAAAGTSSIDQI
nr:hypothetical protein Iba_chr15eCG5640 [Ipomoea batatas]